MESGNVESLYPLTFRENEAKLLGEHLRHRHSVDLVGMKRVGISNFLRYFLHHSQVKEIFISPEEKHFFIPVDLNDLVERELYPFWTLTFKRILDEVEKSQFPAELQQRIASSFLSSIQTKDLFLLIDGVRRSLSLLVAQNYIPTLFFLRFDRIKDVVTPEFFDNLQGLRDGTNGKLSYVFTSFRSLDVLSPQAFSKANLSAFSQILYIKPASEEDMRIIAEQYKKHYRLSLSPSVERVLFRLVGGYVQYLQLALVILNERKEGKELTEEQFLELFTQDERITLQSEELWESLSNGERDAVIRISKGEELSPEDLRNAEYVFETGFVNKDGNDTLTLFSPLFTHYILTHVNHVFQSEKELVFSKKEHLLFSLLQERVGQICERDEIIEGVWPEYREFGVSDWSIDRLVARVRSKLKKQASPFEIRTIRTRGYMLTERA